jgi:hypothetical protein
VFGLARSSLPIAAIVVAPVLLVTQAPLNLLSVLARVASKPGSAPQLAAFADPATGLVLTVVRSIVGLVLVAWMTKLLIHEMKERLPRSNSGPGTSYSIAAGAATEIVYVVAVTFGLVLLFVPGVVLLVRGAVSIPVAVAERRWPIAALRRSWELTRGRHWPIQGVIVLLLLISSAIIAILLAGAQWIPGGMTVLGQSVALTIANVIGWPLVTSVASAMYVRLSIEEELRRFPERAISADGSPTSRSNTGKRGLRYSVYAGVAISVLVGAWCGPQMIERIRSPLNADGDPDLAAVVSPSPASSSQSDTAPSPSPPLIRRLRRVSADATGHVVGTLVDSSGAAVGGAAIEVVREAAWAPGHRGPRKTGSTDRDGTFRIGPVPVGTYTVTVRDPGERYPGFAARANSGIEVGPTGSPDVDLQLEPGTTIRLPYHGPGKLARWTRYFIHDGPNPIVNGFGLRQLGPDLDQEDITFVTLPGTVRLSFDPCFHPEAGIQYLEVSADGSHTGPESLPRTQMVDTSVRVVRDDGEPLGKYDVRLVPACLPPNTDSSIIRNWSLTEGGIRSIRKLKDGLYTNRTAKGVVWRAIVMAEGGRVAESEPFTSGSGQPPPEVVVESATPATITFRVVGLPDGVEREVTPAQFTILFQSPRGILARSSERWSIEEGANNLMTFKSLPAGETIHLLYSTSRDYGTYSARAVIEIKDGAHFDLKPYQHAIGDEPLLWNGQWSETGFIGRGWWQMPVDPSRWLTTY